jgi:glucosamine--fructose-6-phosphate aminotransferase (isomerizing)
MTNSPGLRRQLEELPAVIRTYSPILAERARTILTTPEHHGLQTIVLTGCGDSAIAARAAAFAWHGLTGIPAYALEATDAAHFYGRAHQPWRPHGQLLLAASWSGGTARAIEAAEQFESAQTTLVCAVTSDRSSPLAGSADRSLDVSSGHTFDGPGMCSFILTLLGMFHLAIRNGEVRGRYSAARAGQLRDELTASGDVVDQGLLALTPQVQELARRWSAYELFEFLGVGPGRASAAFGAAKMLEAVGLSAVEQDIESFMHLQYFESATTRIPTVLIDSTRSPVRERIAEVKGYLGRLLRPSVLLTTDTRSEGLIHPAVSELFVPIIQTPILAQLAAELADLHDESPSRRRTGPWADSIDGAAVRKQRIDGT